MPTVSLQEPKCHAPQARGRSSYSDYGRRGVCYTGRSGLPPTRCSRVLHRYVLSTLLFKVMLAFGLQETLSQTDRQGLDKAGLRKSLVTSIRAKLGVPASVENLIVGPGELAQQVRALATLATLPKVLGSMPRTHLALTTFCNSTSRGCGILT